MILLTMDFEAESPINPENIQRFQALDLIPHLAYLTDPNGLVLQVNWRWVEYTGLEPSASLGLAGDEAIHPEDRETVFTARLRALESATPYGLVYRLRRHDGTYQQFLARAEPLRNDSGEITLWVNTATDLTGIRETGHWQRVGDLSVERILEVNPGMLYVFDLKSGANLYVSESSTETLGYTPDEVMSLGADFVGQMIHPEDQPHFAEYLRHLAEGSMGVVTEFAYRMRDRDGGWRWFLSRDTLLKSDTEGVSRSVGAAIDITERRRAEEALLEREERYHSLFDSIDEGFCILELIYDATGQPVDYRFLEVNRVFEEQTGLRGAAGKTVLEMVPNLERHWILTYAGVAATGESVRFSQGSEVMGRWFDVYATRVGTAGSHQVAVVFADVTERRQMDQRLRESESLLQQALEASRSGSWEYDTATRELRYDGGYGPLFGLPAGAGLVNASTLEAYTVEEDRSRGMDSLRRALDAGPGSEFEIEYRIRVPGLPERWVFSRGAVGERLNGGVRIIGTLQDITERKRSEDAVRRSEKFTRTVLEASPDSIKVLDPEGRLVSINSSGLKLREIEDIKPWIGRHWSDFWSDESKNLVHEALQAAQQGEISRFQGFAPTLKGAPRWWDVIVTPIQDAHGQLLHILAVARDVTNAKNVENRLREVNEAQVRFVSDASHELRTPLTSILGNLELLERFPDMPLLERAESIAGARNETSRLVRLVTDLLKVARGEQIPEQFASVKLELALSDAWRVARSLTERRHFDLGALESALVEGDADSLKQLALILLENAIKYTPDGGLIRLESKIVEDFVEFKITDSGVGISKKDLPHVFERFYRADQMRGTDPGGTGLGLPIAQRIVENHGGEIRLESEVGRGTVVTVRLSLQNNQQLPI